MLHVRDLPVVKIAWLLISFWSLLHVFYLLFVRLWGGGPQPFKNFEQLQGLVVCVQ